MLPTKGINSATVYFAGERMAGIASQTYDVTLWIDPNWYADETKEILEQTRTKIKELYTFIHGGESPTWVMFDFEIEED